MDYSKTIELIKSRVTVRHYKDEAPTKEEINKVLEAALLAPSACNRQPWHYHVITDRAVIMEISNAAVEAAGTEMIKKVMEGLGFVQEPEDPIFYGAPVVIVATHKGGIPPMKGIDMGMSFMALELAAASLNLGTINSGFSTMANDKIKEVLKLPEDEEIVLNIGLGYPVGEEPVQPRFDFGERVFMH